MRGRPVRGSVKSGARDSICQKDGRHCASFVSQLCQAPKWEFIVVDRDQIGAKEAVEVITHVRLSLGACRLSGICGQ